MKTNLKCTVDKLRPWIYVSTFFCRLGLCTVYPRIVTSYWVVHIHFSGPFEMCLCKTFITADRKAGGTDEKKVTAKKTHKGCKTYNTGGFG